MAISNAFGSNIFNIFVALGLPWFIQVRARPRAAAGGPPRTAIRSAAHARPRARPPAALAAQVWIVEPGRTFRLESADILSGIRLLVVSFVAYVAVLVATGWRLTVPVGWVCLVGYGVYIVTALASA